VIDNTDAAAQAASDLPAAQGERFARARSRSVFIATPVARNPVRQYTLAILDTMMLLQRVGIKADLHWVVGQSNLARARNELAAAFLVSECTDLLFVDDDMGWQAQHVIRLLASEADYIGGVGRKKDPELSDCSPQTWCFRALPNTREINQDAMGAIEVRGIGTGFVKISRRVFEDVIAARPHLKRPAPASMAEAARSKFYRFFHFEDDEAGCLSEDLAFCEAWRQLGGTVWADPTIELVHVGDREFTGSFAALLAPEAAAKEVA
jgi:hypothetical protein